MKRITQVVLALIMTCFAVSSFAGFGARSGGFGGGGFRGSSFGGSRSYSSFGSRSYSAPRPSYVAPTRPVTVNRTVVQQNVTHVTNVTHAAPMSGGGGGGFMSSMFGSMAGSSLSNWFFMNHNNNQQPQVQQVAVNCADPQNKTLPVCNQPVQH